MLNINSDKAKVPLVTWYTFREVLESNPILGQSGIRNDQDCFYHLHPLLGKADLALAIHATVASQFN